MGGGLDEWRMPLLTNQPRTMILIGRSGNGKSATGNSILGKSAFESRLSLSGVTSHLQCHSSSLVTGEVVNVIDTPDMTGLFSCNETLHCDKLPKEGINAVLLVISLRERFTKEDAVAVQRLSHNITDYMIVVFSGGDCLGKDESLDNYLGPGCPEALQEILRACKNRYVVFDNNTEDEIKKVMQLLKLLSLVDDVMEDNGGQAYYTNNLLTDIKEEAQTKQEVIMNDEQFKRVVEMAECKLKDSYETLRQELADEVVARLRAEGDEDEEDAQKDSDQDALVELTVTLLFLLCAVCLIYSLS